MRNGARLASLLRGLGVAVAGAVLVAAVAYGGGLLSTDGDARLAHDGVIHTED